MNPAPGEDAAVVTTGQLRGVTEQLIAVGRWQPCDLDILVVVDAAAPVSRLVCHAGRGHIPECFEAAGQGRRRAGRKPPRACRARAKPGEGSWPITSKDEAKGIRWTRRASVM
ncbi:hypothetical protein Cs7R123_63840 [Catellatospora sp. TT07R-123]|nr:hypothetical protein Cs7R123_63840 [Catellatospora sp. TT07R-123]